MSTFALKLVAIICMLIDHIGAVFMEGTSLYNPMRVIGRIAFPLFAFLIVEGYYHTRDVKKYMLRLGIFALISEIPFDLAFNHKLFYWSYQNIFFTLFIGLVVIYFLEEARKKYPVNSSTYTLVEAGAILGGCILSIAIFSDYNILGILTILVFYIFRGKLPMIFIGLVALHGLLLGNLGIQTAAVLSVVFIVLYNGKKGPSLKYFFYAFYPVHLIIIYCIDKFLVS